MSFLPDDYKEPNTSRYMKFEDGENKFRALGQPIIGQENWAGGKPVRWHYEGDEPKKVWDTDKNGNARRSKRFWAFPVWNYATESVQILEITQITIQKAIRALTQNPKWGSPYDYDITVTRTGEGFDTEYSVIPDPKEKLDPEVKKAYEETNIDLDALFTGDDPFKSKEDVNPDDIPL